MHATRGANIIGDFASGSQKNMVGVKRKKKTGLWAIKVLRKLKIVDHFDSWKAWNNKLSKEVFEKIN